MKVELTARGRGAVLWRNAVWAKCTYEEQDILTYVYNNDMRTPEGSDFPVVEGVNVGDMCYELKMVDCDDLVSKLVLRKLLRPVRG